MNTLVNNMVELLFKNTEENDEVRALRDELMANCNAHYEDLIQRGVSEQEALSAVAESLQGMEEVVSQYPVKAEAVTAVPEAAPAEPEAASVAEPEKEEEVWHDAREIRVEVKAWDVRIVPSQTDRVNVKAEGERADLLEIRFDNGLLTVKEKDEMREPQDFFGKLQKLNWESFDSLIRSVRGVVSEAINSAGGVITIEVPGAVEKIEHHSASGNLQVENVTVGQLISNTASGDIDVGPAGTVEAVKAHSASGDVRATVNAKTAELESMSGDVCVNGACEQLKASSVSGDVHCTVACAGMKLSSVSGDVQATCENTFVQEATMQSTSGDIHFELRQAGVRSLKTQTVSGDVMVLLPADGQTVHLTTNTLSGDVETNVEDAGADAAVNITVKTMSGDIKVRTV